MGRGGAKMNEAAGLPPAGAAFRSLAHCSPRAPTAWPARSRRPPHYSTDSLACALQELAWIHLLIRHLLNTPWVPAPS